MKRDFERIEAEIRQEKAEALGRAGERLERKLAELADLRNELLSHPDVASTSPATTEMDSQANQHEKVEKYARLMEEAQQARHYLRIQREAVGLRRHEDVDRQYPVPPPLRPPMINSDRDKESP
jgi:predicted phage gp36 major capsid-like protein